MNISRPVPETPLPLKDGQTFRTVNGKSATVAGEIRGPHDEPICSTVQGDWFRRSDGEPMTGGGTRPMPVHEWFSERWGWDPSEEKEA